MPPLVNDKLSSLDTAKDILIQSLGIAGEQFTYVLRTLKQFNPGKSYSENINDSIKSKGISKTYLDGSVFTASQVVSRQAIRGGIIATANQLVPQDIKDNHPTIERHFGNISMIAFDPFPHTFFLNARTKQMTSANKVGIIDAIKKNPFQGFVPAATCQWIFLPLMLYIDQKAKEHFKADDLSIPQKAASAAVVCAAYVPITAPLDMVRVRMQAQNSTIKTMGQGLSQLWQESQINPSKIVRYTNIKGRAGLLLNFFSYSNAGISARSVSNFIPTLTGMAAIDWVDKVSRNKDENGSSKSF